METCKSVNNFFTINMKSIPVAICGYICIYIQDHITYQEIRNFFFALAAMF